MLLQARLQHEIPAMRSVNPAYETLKTKRNRHLRIRWLLWWPTIFQKSLPRVKEKKPSTHLTWRGTSSKQGLSFPRLSHKYSLMPPPRVTLIQQIVGSTGLIQSATT